jgi:bile acid-coenzyme A ligase
MPRFDAAEWVRLAAGCTWAPLNPTAMARILEVPDRPALDLDVLHVGARCPGPVKRAWLDWLGPERVTEVYAGSESQGVACIRGPEWLAHPGSVGRGVGGTEFAVRRPDGSPADPGEQGEIVMRRPGVAYSYVGAEPTDRDGWHTLGDAGWLDADGYLYVGDRLADLIETADGWLAPADVEAVLDAHPGVRSSAVVRRDGAILAVVEGRPADLEAWVAARLPAAHRPAAYRFTDEPVRDDAGKVRRSAL